jgi:cytochrome P450
MATSVHDLDLPKVSAGRPARVLAQIEEARDQHWLARTEMGYSVLRYEDVQAILRERQFHHAISKMGKRSGGGEKSPDDPPQRSILAMEGLEHARVRRIAAPAFTPKASDRLRPYMREVINGLFDPYAENGRVELVADVCEAYPIPIICELLGAPKEDAKLFSVWAPQVFRLMSASTAEELATAKAAVAELEDYVRAMIDDRRSKPADDLLSVMIAAEEEGDRLTTGELVMMCEAVLLGGVDTTRNQLAASVALLVHHPDQWAALKDDPELAPRAVEETMRVTGIVGSTARIASEDIEYRDVVFPVGTLVETSLLGANNDPDVFPDPQRFDITREPSGSPQMTFGSGIHFCLGASLARAELQEALALLARRMPDLSLDRPIEWRPGSSGVTPAVLPLRFTPTPRVRQR